MADFFHTDVIPGGLTIISDEFNTITVDQNGVPRPLKPRTFDFFSQMAGENAESRIYLGIHWQFDAIEGIRCGDHIADYVYTHALTPIHGGRPVALPSSDPVAQIALAVALENVAAKGGLRGHGGHGELFVNDHGDAVDHLIASAFLQEAIGNGRENHNADSKAPLNQMLLPDFTMKEDTSLIAGHSHNRIFEATRGLGESRITPPPDSDGDLFAKLFEAL
jgi:hypothetical protein